MNAMDLQRENERLKKLLTQSRRERTQAQTQLTQAHDTIQQSQAQHQAVAAQFTETLEAKQRQVASLEHQIKLLLQRIRGSRQERIDPAQLLLFSLEELQEIAGQIIPMHRPDPGDIDNGGDLGEFGKAMRNMIKDAVIEEAKRVAREHELWEKMQKLLKDMLKPIFSRDN